MTRLRFRYAAGRRALSLDFDPRRLVTYEPVPTPCVASDPRTALDAIFIPCKGRPHYTQQLLESLRADPAPVFLLPTSRRDHPPIPSSRRHLVQSLSSDDPGFHAALTRLRCSSNPLCTSYFGDWDLPAKRNYALWYARQNRMKRILLLDDDISSLQSAAISAATKILDRFSLSGFFVHDFPDTSAVGHVEIALGENVSTFLSGSCLFVRADQDRGFFPPIYNEDWLFMLPDIAEGRVCSLGTISQKPYDPFRTASVAPFQEPGEVIADGLFALAAAGRYAERFDQQNWRQILRLRRDWLSQLRRRAAHPAHYRILDCAIGTLAGITEANCLNFIHDWETDRQSWRKTLDQLS